MDTCNGDKEVVTLTKELVYVDDHECCLCFYSEKCLAIKETCMVISYDGVSGEPSSPTNKRIADIERIERISTVCVSDVEKNWFDDEQIPDDIVLSFTCKEHYICVQCLRKLINNYENHQINEHSSNIYCPFPFQECESQPGFRNVVDHESVKKFCRTTEELEMYETHAYKYRFPGFEVVTCPGKYLIEGSEVQCGAEILVAIEEIKNTPKGQLIIECDQNFRCTAKFCYTCEANMFLRLNCTNCMLTNESEDPNAFNHYFNTPSDQLMFRNKEISVELALEQIHLALRDLNEYFICPVCKISLYKTEKCNEMSHHHIDRCYSCGRIGDKVRGLFEHWNGMGIGGCYRFNSDPYLTKNVPTYKCHENVCFDHDLGDCSIDEHQQGIIDLENDRKRNIVYHMLKSLLPETRDAVLKELYSTFADKEFYQYLPWAYTFGLISKHTDRNCDCNEVTVYQQLALSEPMVLLGSDRSNLIPIAPLPSPVTNNSDAVATTSNRDRVIDETISYWRRFFIHPTLQTQHPDTDSDERDALDAFLESEEGTYNMPNLTSARGTYVYQQLGDINSGWPDWQVEDAESDSDDNLDVLRPDTPSSQDVVTTVETTVIVIQEEFVTIDINDTDTDTDTA
jgi:hypothetical protein